MNVLIVDFFNLIKRYTFLIDSAEELDGGEFYSDVATKIVNKIVKTCDEYKIDFAIICSDLGFNRRANSVLSGEYKANRVRAKSATQEEKEKYYVEKLKDIVKSLPYFFVEVNDVEADNIIYFAIKFFRKNFDKPFFYVATTDTDMLQLLSDDVSIINWNKGLVTIDNWTDVHKFDCKYLKPGDYALLKSIVGDKSDNIEGVKGLGWKKVLSMLTFLYTKLGKKVTLTNIDSVISYLTAIKESYAINKKEQQVCDKILDVIDRNLETIKRNFSIISLDMLETPYVAKIMDCFEDALSTKITFSPEEFLRRLQFKERFGSEEDYDAIYDKNLKLLYRLKRIAAVSDKFRQAARDGLE